jgi:hypothetical protein
MSARDGSERRWRLGWRREKSRETVSGSTCICCCIFEMKKGHLLYTFQQLLPHDLQNAVDLPCRPFLGSCKPTVSTLPLPSCTLSPPSRLRHGRQARLPFAAPPPAPAHPCRRRNSAREEEQGRRGGLHGAEAEQERPPRRLPRRRSHDRSRVGCEHVADPAEATADLSSELRRARLPLLLGDWASSYSFPGRHLLPRPRSNSSSSPLSRRLVHLPQLVRRRRPDGELGAPARVRCPPPSSPTATCFLGLLLRRAGANYRAAMRDAKRTTAGATGPSAYLCFLQMRHCNLLATI